MIICICNNISERKIQSTIESKNGSISSIKELRTHLTVCNQCGKCREIIEKMIQSNFTQETI